MFHGARKHYYLTIMETRFHTPQVPYLTAMRPLGRLGFREFKVCNTIVELAVLVEESPPDEKTGGIWFRWLEISQGLIGETLYKQIMHLPSFDDLSKERMEKLAELAIHEEQDNDEVDQ